MPEASSKAVAIFPVRMDGNLTMIYATRSRNVISRVMPSKCWTGYDASAHSDRVFYFVGDPDLPRITAAFNTISVPKNGWVEPEMGRPSISVITENISHEWLISNDANVELFDINDIGVSDFASPRLAGTLVRHLLELSGATDDVFGGIIIPDCAVSSYRNHISLSESDQHGLIAGYLWLAFTACPSSASTGIDNSLFDIRSITDTGSLDAVIPSILPLDHTKLFVSRSEAIFSDTFSIVTPLSDRLFAIQDDPDQALYQHLSASRFFISAEAAGDVSGTDLDDEWYLTVWEFQPHSAKGSRSAFSLIPRGLTLARSADFRSDLVSLFQNAEQLRNIPVSPNSLLGSVGVSDILFIDEEGYPIDPSSAYFRDQFNFVHQRGIFGAIYERSLSLARGLLISAALASDDPAAVDLSGIEGLSKESVELDSGSGSVSLHEGVSSPPITEGAEQSLDASPHEEISNASDPAIVPSFNNSSFEVGEAYTPGPQALAVDAGEVDQSILDALSIHWAELERLLSAHHDEISSAVSAIIPPEGEMPGEYDFSTAQMTFFTDERINENGLSLISAVLGIYNTTTAEAIEEADLDSAWLEREGAKIAAIYFVNGFYGWDIPADDHASDDTHSGAVSDETGDGTRQVLSPHDSHADSIPDLAVPLSGDQIKLSADIRHDTGEQEPDYLAAADIANTMGTFAGRISEEIEAVGAALRQADGSTSLRRLLSTHLVGLGLSRSAAESSRAYAYARAVLANEHIGITDERLEEIRAGAETRNPLSVAETAAALITAANFWKDNARKSELNDDLSSLENWRFQRDIDVSSSKIMKAVMADDAAASSLRATLQDWWHSLRNNIEEDHPERADIAGLMTQHLFHLHRESFDDDPDLAEIAAKAERNGLKATLAAANLPENWQTMSRAALVQALKENSKQYIAPETAGNAASGKEH